MWRAAQTNSLSLALAAISQPSHEDDSVGSWHFSPHSVDSPLAYGKCPANGEMKEKQAR